MFSGRQSIAGPSDSTPTSRLSRPYSIINELGENENSQNHIKKNLKKPLTNYPVRSELTRQRGRRSLLKNFLEETYGVKYSILNCQRLLKEAELSYQKPRRRTAEADEDEQEVFHDKPKKAAGAGHYRSLYRPNQEICAIQAACRVVSAQRAALCRILGATQLDVSAGRNH